MWALLVVDDAEGIELVLQFFDRAGLVLMSEPFF